MFGDQLNGPCCLHLPKAVFHFSSIVFQYGFEPTPPPTPEEEESEEEQDEDEDGLTGGEDDGDAGGLVVMNQKQ